MKKSKLKIMLILSVFLALAMILCIFIFKNPKDKQEYNIDKKEAKILEIENKKIYDISSSISKKGVTTKIKNISANPVRNITIDYVELDKDNKYNGYITPMWDSESKKKAIKELCEKYDIDLSKSYAYGDTAGDFTMFKSVGIPYAMNPTRELITKIMDDEELKKKINIIVERKDVTYQLDVNCLNLL